LLKNTLVLASLFFTTNQTWATEYAFKVTCEHREWVEIWKTSDLDPGREYLKFATAARNWNCSVSDATEADKAINTIIRHEGGSAIFDGIPSFVGQVLKGLFWD
jgi:hypothetical protein